SSFVSRFVRRDRGGVKAHEYDGQACPEKIVEALSGSARAARGATKSSAVMMPPINACVTHWRDTVSQVRLHEREQKT
ncbi:MAG: hypothetical protein O7G83_06675, partial [Proteobacteria bacterium]|nr:hypothetical protein [Pseudomonadota bacterium]